MKMHLYTWLSVAMLWVSFSCGAQLIPDRVPPAPNKPKDSTTQQQDGTSKDKAANLEAAAVQLSGTATLQPTPVTGKQDGKHEAVNVAEWLIALFTFGLVWVTRDLAHFTKKLWAATDHLVGTESPLVIFTSVVYDDSIKSENMNGRQIYAKINFGNCGKAPAILTSLNVKVIPITANPGTSEALFTFSEQERMPLSYSIIQNEFDNQEVCRETGTADDNATLLLVTEIVYENPFGGTSRSRECRRFELRGNFTSVRFGGKQYNYASRDKNPQQ